MERVHRRNGVPLPDHIAATAAELFYERGIANVGVDAIADRAQVTKRTLYRHFASKDALVAASLQHGPFVRFPPAGEPQARIIAAFDDLVRFVNEPAYRGCPYINAGAELSRNDHPAHAIVERQTARRRAWFERRLRELHVSGAELLAEQLDVLFDGALANATKRRNALPALAARSAAQTLLDYAGSGVRARSASAPA
jgi:AcrR family transcriptional regulator